MQMMVLDQKKLVSSFIIKFLLVIISIYSEQPKKKEKKINLTISVLCYFKINYIFFLF